MLSGQQSGALNTIDVRTSSDLIVTESGQLQPGDAATMGLTLDVRPMSGVEK